MSDLHREKTGTSTHEDSRSHHLKGGTHLSLGRGERPTLIGAAARGSPPIKANLTDPASIDFKDLSLAHV